MGKERKTLRRTRYRRLKNPTQLPATTRHHQQHHDEDPHRWQQQHHDEDRELFVDNGIQRLATWTSYHVPRVAYVLRVILGLRFHFLSGASCFSGSGGPRPSFDKQCCHPPCWLIWYIHKIWPSSPPRCQSKHGTGIQRDA